MPGSFRPTRVLLEYPPSSQGDIEWQAERMLEYAEQKDPEAVADFNRKIEEMTAKSQLQQDSMSLQQLLELHNDAQELAANKALYIDTN